MLPAVLGGPRKVIALIDVSQYQESVDFAEARRHGIWGVYLRATMGVADVDTLFSVRVVHARKAGLNVGTYHYAYPNLHSGKSGASEEANHYATILKRYNLTRYLNLRPMLDMEEPSAGGELWARYFNKVCMARGIGMPLFYSYSSFIEAMRIEHGPIGAGLVIAAYGKNDGKDYPVYAPKPWKGYVAHQFTSKGRIPGVVGNVDVWHSTHPYALASNSHSLISWFT